MTEKELCGARQYLYTAASFGHSGINGFQFVGCPANTDAASLIKSLDAYVGYAPPVDAPSQPQPQALEDCFPVSIRILPQAVDDGPLVVRSAYIGQVYQEGLRRGKWGNFFAHVLLLDKGVELARLFKNLPLIQWRQGLTDEELNAGQPLLLPDTMLFDATSDQQRDALQAEHLASALAGVLARLDGDAPVLFNHTDDRIALAIFAQIAGFLPEGALSVLTWSTYEYDGNADYDVIASSGETKVTLTPSAYQLSNAAVADNVYTWAALKLLNESDRFWATVGAIANHDIRQPFGGVELRQIFENLRSLEAEPDSDGRTEEMISAIMQGPATDAAVFAAEMVFSLGFSAFETHASDDFHAMARASLIADDLRAWAKSSWWSDQVTRWGSGVASLRLLFERQQAQSSFAEMIDTQIAEGHPPALILLGAVKASKAFLQEEQNASLFVEVLAEAIPKLQADDVLETVCKSVEADPVLHATFVHVLLHQFRFHEAKGFFELTDTLRASAPALSNTYAEDCERDIIASHYSTIEADLTVVLAKLSQMDVSASSPDQRTEIICNLDKALGLVTAPDRPGNAKKLLKISQTVGVPPDDLPNTICQMALSEKRVLADVLKNKALRQVLKSSVSPADYAAFAESGWKAYAPKDLDSASQAFEALQRDDVGGLLSDLCIKHFLNIASARGQLQVNWVEAALIKLREGSIATLSPFMADALHDLVIRLGVKLDEEDLAELFEDFPDSAALAEADRKRRKSITSVVKSALSFSRNLLNRKGRS